MRWPSELQFRQIWSIAGLWALGRGSFMKPLRIEMIRDDESRHVGNPAADARPGRRILIVEDNYFVAHQCESALLDAGYDVVDIVETADEAVQVAISICPGSATASTRRSRYSSASASAASLPRRSPMRRSRRARNRRNRLLGSPNRSTIASWSPQWNPRSTRWMPWCRRIPDRPSRQAADPLLMSD